MSRRCRELLLRFSFPDGDGSRGGQGFASSTFLSYSHLGDLRRDSEFIVTQRVADVTCCGGTARGLSKELSDRELGVTHKMCRIMEW